MSNIEVVYTCPLGHVCEEVRDNKIYRCRWYKELAGTHPQTGEQVDEWDCAIGWGTVLGVEVARTNRGQTQAIESMRNETIKRQDAFLGSIEVNKRLK